MRNDETLDHGGESLERDVKNVPEKGGFAGRFLIILIAVGVLGIIILAVLLMGR